MKIAVLAWSPRLAGPAWRQDGPLLPIEFVRRSAAVGLVPVLCDAAWIVHVPTLWAMATPDGLVQARRALAAQEGISRDDIGYVQRNAQGVVECRINSLPAGPGRDALCARLTQWLQDHALDAVIWPDQTADLPNQHDRDLAQAAVAAQLNGLPPATLATAARYVQQTPLQIWTVLRAHLAAERGWLPGTTAPLPPISTADDLRFKDWDQCRTTIGRMDTILEDLRKFGFTLITALLTAGAFLGFLGVPSAPNGPTPPADARAAPFLAIMVLVAALFSVDTYYQVLLSAAVERALDLETRTMPPIRVTKYLSINATASYVGYITLFLYLALLATAGGLGLLATGGLNLGRWSSAGPNLGPLSAGELVWLVGLGVIVVVLVLAAWLYRSRPDWLLLGIAGTLGVWFSGGLGLLLLGRMVPNPPTVLPWIVVAGTLLALYIELYWIYAALRSGLHREKPTRIWPEGPKKDPAW